MKRGISERVALYRGLSLDLLTPVFARPPKGLVPGQIS